MPVYMIRWPNGDIGLAFAANAEKARYQLDQFGEPLNLPIRRLRGDEFAMSLRLHDDFTFEVDEWGEEMADALEWAYPVVTKFRRADMESDNPNPGHDEAMKKAVADERVRVEQARDRGQQSFMDDYVARHPGEPPSKEDIDAITGTTGMTPDKVAKWDEERRKMEVADIPVRKARCRRARRGGDPH
jgi:hypothetical protein